MGSEPNANQVSDERFAFGANWRRFLERLGPEQIENSRLALERLLGDPPLTGLSFLDVGSGSGLSSLAAQRLGAGRIISFDYDQESVVCTTYLRDAQGDGKHPWVVQQGSTLDASFLESLGTFDVVYAWGVLHHTGRMWEAIDLVARRTKPGGRFALAIYNDQGWQSRVWWWVKRAYVHAPSPVQKFIAGMWLCIYVVVRSARELVRGRPFDLPYFWRQHRSRRGMSVWFDVVDWVGGFPFEVATPNAITSFLQARGFELARKSVVGSRPGCNEFVFVRGA